MSSQLFCWLLLIVCRVIWAMYAPENLARKYTVADTVRCLDTLEASLNEKWIHLAFLGDSRMRQQFYSFLEFVPTHDIKQYDTSHRSNMAHHTMSMESDLLRLNVSFHWHPTADENLLKKLKSWTEAKDPPTLVYLGVSAHYMIRKNNLTDRYEQHLTERLAPILRELSSVTEVIWFRQVPVIERFAVQAAHNTDIHSEKLDQHSRISDRIIKESGVMILDALHEFADYYIHGCRLNVRDDQTWFYNCKDYIHTGFVAVTHSTQMLLNHLCATQEIA